MSLKAKIEAVIYAAEEPVTLAQLAGVFAQELPAAEPELEEEPSIDRCSRKAFSRPRAFRGDPDHAAEMALLSDEEKRKEQEAAAHPAAAKPRPNASHDSASARSANRSRRSSTS
jgi:segregation and condensation protein B